MIALLVGFLVWQAAAARYSSLVSGPVEVFQQVWTWTIDGTLWANASVTFVEVMIGLVLSFVLGIIIGVLLSISRWIDAGTRPYIDVLNSIPRIGLAPLFVLWFGLGIDSKVALIVSVVIFIVIVNVQSGIESVDRDQILLVRSLGATRRDIIRKVVFPSLLPWLIASLRLGVAYGVAAAVVAEFIAASEGLGYLLAYRSAILDTTGAFAALVILAVMAWILTKAIMAFEHRVLFWRRAGHDGETDSGFFSI